MSVPPNPLPDQSASIGNLSIGPGAKYAEIIDGSGGSALNLLLLITLAKSISSAGKVSKLSDTVLRVDYEHRNRPVQLTVNWDTVAHDKLDFYHFHWTKPEDEVLDHLEDALGIGTESDGTFWYGGMNPCDLQWPIDKTAEYGNAEFVLNDIYQFTKVSGQERYWLSSKKVALSVPWTVPLWTSVEKSELNIRAQLKGSQFLLRNNHLEYTLAVDKHGNLTLKEFHQQCFAKFLKAPTAAPDSLIMEKPIWSTWATFWVAVNQTQVESYVDEINSYGMPISQLELDDMWTTAYGDYQIDSAKFPDFAGMVNYIRNKTSARLTAWVHPFVNNDSKNGQDLSLRNTIFMKSSQGDVPLTWWWDCPVTKDSAGNEEKKPCAYILDLTNSDARDWWRTQLKNMQKEGIYTFKFDAGETNWFPKNFALNDGQNPNSFGRDYAHFAAEFGPAVENRYGSNTQDANIFMRTMDRSSYWDKSEGEGGLSTLIPWALQASLHGYYWNLPDMVGGNGIDHSPTNIKGNPPEEELYIRWTQANAFLLAMQFSYPPWHPSFNQSKFKVVEQVKNVLELRAKWMPYILESVEDAVKNGEPVIRPMWWSSDNGTFAYSCKDQYMVGWKLVVAPVLQKGKTKRDIFLPRGEWKDGNRGDEAAIIVGETLLKDYDAPLDTLPFFYRVNGAIKGAVPSLVLLFSLCVSSLLSRH
ncbi:hypothetical protein niasHT_006816 [Heterodera trifolii]|uniref:Uncharacterized protein n=1 Tax=Heterodera trifolii TaxID=157864 RepID=A0ABD2M6Y0_9BILA